MSDGFRDPIFKGCTRPAMLGGVPTVPLILISALTLLCAVWSFYLVSGYLSLFILFVTIPVVVTMREMTKKDDQRLRQVLMRARMRLRRYGPAGAPGGRSPTGH